MGFQVNLEFGESAEKYFKQLKGLSESKDNAELITKALAFYKLLLVKYGTGYEIICRDIETGNEERINIR